ncbi:MAG: hypothetical protein ABJP45_10010 [Cyclobacteriaceae bacterium]
MRLGQLARKYDVSLQEVISYLNELAPASSELHSNSKLDEKTETLIAKRFELLFDEPEELDVEIEEAPKEIEKEPAPDTVSEKPPLHEVTLEESEVPEVLEEDEVTVQEKQTSSGLETSDLDEMTYLMQEVEGPLPEKEVEEQPPVAEVQTQQREKDETIETDRLLELLESEEASVDLSKITLIKAPKKELDGLKVVGKIEIAEPKVEESEENDQPTKPKFDSETLALRQKQREELREQRRLIAKKKEEEQKARQEKRVRDREKKKVKAQKEAHYKSKLKQNTPKQSKQKAETPVLEPATKMVTQRPKPKTLVGKFWRWLNT